MYKNNKRKYTGKSHTYKKTKGYKGNLKKSQKGYYRTSGAYGRYQRPGKDGELKFHNVSIASQPVPAAGEVTELSLNLIAQNTTETGRIGRKIVIKKIMFRLTARIQDATDPTVGFDEIRIICYQDKQCNGATAAYTDIMANGLHEFRNLNNTGRFKILWDENFEVNGGGISGDGTTIDLMGKAKTIIYYKDVNIPIEFDATTGAITEIKSNNIGLLMISLEQNARVTGVCRIRFSDN